MKLYMKQKCSKQTIVQIGKRFAKSNPSPMQAVAAPAALEKTGQ
jgi:hypothetical protein